MRFKEPGWPPVENRPPVEREGMVRGLAPQLLGSGVCAWSVAGAGRWGPVRDTDSAEACRPAVEPDQITQELETAAC